MNPGPTVPIMNAAAADRVCGLLARWANALRDSDRDTMDAARRSLERFGVRISRERLPYRDPAPADPGFARMPN